MLSCYTSHMDFLTPYIPYITFFVVLQFANAFNWKPLVSAVIAVGVPQLFTSYRSYILADYDLAGFQLLSVGGALIALFQLCVAYFVFYKQGQMDSSLIQWIFFTMFGALAIYILVPTILSPLL